MGRAVATKGERMLGRTIRKLEGSVEFSSKECKAKVQEQKYKQQTQASMGSLMIRLFRICVTLRNGKKPSNKAGTRKQLPDRQLTFN